MTTHRILAFYYFVAIEDPSLEVQRHHTYLAGRDIRCRIYISHEGINAQMSATEEEAVAYMQWLQSDARFDKINFKINSHHEHVFPRITVKFRQQLVALDEESDLQYSAERLSPSQWQQKLEQRDEETLLLDVRNAYEWEIGHFEGAVLPPLESFRQFPSFARKLKTERDPQKTSILMYCTGGIRCELFSAFLKKEGFQKVYQLEGGVIAYSQEKQGKYWKGRLFVFDDRLSIPMGTEVSEEMISCCSVCQTPSDRYYNCANMDCNALFILCSVCAKEQEGCCSVSCRVSSRRRPFDEEGRPKPFKKWYHYPSLADLKS
jgi:UPF0176 protein